MKFKAITVIQNGVTFYETALDAENLTDEELFVPDRWNPATNEGYQREISVVASDRLADYLKNPSDINILPTSVLINSRSGLRVTPLSEGIVEIEVKTFPLYIVDGQHRIAGLRNAIANGETELERFQLGVTLTQFGLRDEMINFRNINARATKPPRSLADLIMGNLAKAYGIIPSTMAEQAQIRAGEVVQRLATDSNSPWYAHVALGGVRRRSYHYTVQSALARSIDTMFTNGRFSDPDEDKGHIYRIFLSYWQALAQIWPEAFENPYQYGFMRGSGFYVWHQVLSRILNNVNLNPTKEQFMKTFSEMLNRTGWESEYWKVTNPAGVALIGAGRSQSVRIGQVADVIWRELDKDLLRETEHEGG